MYFFPQVSQKPLIKHEHHRFAVPSDIGHCITDIKCQRRNISLQAGLSLCMKLWDACSMHMSLFHLPGVGGKSCKQRTENAAWHQSQLLPVIYLHTTTPTKNKHLGNSAWSHSFSPLYVLFLNNSEHPKCFCTMPTHSCSVIAENERGFKLPREEVILFKDEEHHVWLKTTHWLHLWSYSASFAPSQNHNITPTLQMRLEWRQICYPFIIKPI